MENHAVVIAAWFIKVLGIKITANNGDRINIMKDEGFLLNQIDNIRSAWNRGLLTQFDVRESLARMIDDEFKSLFKQHRIIKHLGPKNKDCWERFYDDYRMWERGEEPCSTKGNMWLTYMRPTSSCNGDGDNEASPKDKICYFEIMKFFHIPTEVFCPPPKGVICPDVRLGHYPDNIVIGTDIWGDSKELLSDGFELGNEITLTDHLGLKTVMKITNHISLREKENSMWKKDYDYVGEGTIEGYTSRREREIKIYIYNGRVSSLLTITGPDDVEEFNKYPLWKEFRNWQQEIFLSWEKVYDNLWGCYIQQSL